MKTYGGYRSEFELNIARKLKENKVDFEYENYKIEYIHKTRVYTPDFYLPITNIYVEAKGYLDKDDRVKMLLVQDQHPDLDIRFVFLRANNKIHKKRKTTYGDWCTKNNFKWAEGFIPIDWIRHDKTN